MKIKFDRLYEFNCFLRKCKAGYTFGIENEEQEIELDFEFEEE